MVTPGRDSSEGTVGKAYRRLVGVCARGDVVWDDGHTTAEFPGHLESPR